ncbi:MAG: polyamine aminopropyltransferase [Gemmatimonadetes bacterium]|nr:MAG: polyamine aminopropyltransferase [Gemmatimonadota bacterium]
MKILPSFLRIQSSLRIQSPESAVLYLSMFAMGACGIAYEYTLSKVAADLLGNSTRQWAIIIGVMMFFMGLGADLQKYFSDRHLFDKFIVIEVLLGILGGFGPIILLNVFGKWYSHYALVQYVFICSIGLLIGFEIPLLARINESYMHELKVNIGGILKMDYIGALFGALAWILILPKFFTLIEMGFVLGIFNIGVAALTLFYFRRLVGQKLWIGILTALSLVMLLTGLNQGRNWTRYAEQYLYRDRIIFSHTTDYQHIVLTKSPANDLSCYINGHLQFNSFDEHIYHENLVHPALSIAPQRERILVLGGGDGLAVREILKYPEVTSVTVCDLDPQMTGLAQTQPDLVQLNRGSLLDSRVMVLRNHALVPAGQETLYVENQQKPYSGETGAVAVVQVINMDAAKFIEQISGVYDVIIIDFPDPNSIELAKLYSRKFYTDLRRKLSADGILVQQATSPVHAKEAFLCIGRTMQAAGLAVVPYHDNVPSFGEWGWWIGGRADRYSASHIRERLNRIDHLPADRKYLTPSVIRSTLIFGQNQLKSDFQDINTIVTNRVYDYYVQGWQRF